MEIPRQDQRLPLEYLLQLKRWNTPTIYNGWEQITKHDSAADCFNIEETRDFMPEQGPMIGYAATVVIEPSKKAHKANKPTAKSDYRRYLASVPDPKIVVVQDLDKPRIVGSFWGEVNANIHRALGCVGTITDGSIRDLDEMKSAGFKAIAQRLCVGHAHAYPVEWGVEVEVFGRKVKPGQLIHADKHGFLVIPNEDKQRLLEASLFMDQNECNTVIKAAREQHGSYEEMIECFDKAGAAFTEAAREKFGHGQQEW
ncbi:protein DlpA-like [Corticium candelabrum]|uniref:protein DlpA-like n=1 Tax=Corticium candelabrum TaxID=121492 RepID=UPI002E26AAA6|nr:protein DlpA-like [Corticium candelabrum]